MYLVSKKNDENRKVTKANLDEIKLSSDILFFPSLSTIFDLLVSSLLLAISTYVSRGNRECHACVPFLCAYSL